MGRNLSTVESEDVDQAQTCGFIEKVTVCSSEGKTRHEAMEVWGLREEVVYAAVGEAAAAAAEASSRAFWWAAMAAVTSGVFSTGAGASRGAKAGTGTGCRGATTGAATGSGATGRCEPERSWKPVIGPAMYVNFWTSLRV